MKKVGKSRRTVMGLMLVIAMCSLTACTTKQAKESESSRYAMNETVAEETNKETETKKENKTEEKILKYLLDFLDSYDFSSGAGESLITEENRDIINSAVLGLNSLLVEMP